MTPDKPAKRKAKQRSWWVVTNGDKVAICYRQKRHAESSCKIFNKPPHYGPKNTVVRVVESPVGRGIK